MIHGYTIAINSTDNCDRVPLPHLHDVHFPQKSSTVKCTIIRVYIEHCTLNSRIQNVSKLTVLSLFFLLSFLLEEEKKEMEIKMKILRSYMIMYFVSTFCE